MITSGGGGFLRNGGNVNQRFPGKKYVFGGKPPELKGLKKSASAQQIGGGVNDSRLTAGVSKMESDLGFLENAGRHRSSVDDIDAENKQPRKVLDQTSITADILTAKHKTDFNSPYIQKLLQKSQGYKQGQ